MRFIQENGYDVEQGRAGEYKAWLEENEAELAKSCPAGVEYLGTFAVVYSDHREGGGFRTLFQLDSYGAQDAMAAALGEPGRFRDLMMQAMSFGDWRNEARGTTTLMKAATAATIIDPTG